MKRILKKILPFKLIQILRQAREAIQSNRIPAIPPERKIILIYQMGKVGSSSLQRSLQQLKLNANIYHVHALEPNSIRDMKRNAKKNFPKSVFRNLRRSFLKIYSDAKVAKMVSYYLKRDRKFFIVSLVREPVARNISAFFQIADRRFVDFHDRVQEGSLGVDELMSVFLEKHDHEWPLIWFDKEMKWAFDIDVFLSDFPKSKGYKIYKNEKAELLLIKFEKLTECAGEAFYEFLGIRDFTLCCENVSENKRYSNIYQDFKTNSRLPLHYINRMYDSKLVTHFYTTEEIHTFRDKWKKTS